MGILNLLRQELHTTPKCRSCWWPFSCPLVAIAYGQGTERCGIFGDCICRPDCFDGLEREGIWTECSNSLDKCCCAEETCGIFDDCSCRTNCEGDEYPSFIDECENGSLTCCCQE